MQFISVCENGKYMVNPTVYELLSTMSAPIRVISCIGRTRSGKSSLLNMLTNSSKFVTSSTVQATTKGIIIHRLDATTLIVDTEGLGSTEVTRDHDTYIFALAMLISSACIFNNHGSITSQSLDDVFVATKVAGLLCKHIRFNKHLPELVWVMRDFTLDICDRSGIPMSPSEYMEQCLDQYTMDKSNDIRSLFTNRYCFSLPRPTMDDIDLKEMTNIRKEFVDGVGSVLTHLRKCPPKMMGNHQTNGIQIYALCEALCDAINKNVVPNLEDVWSILSIQSRVGAVSVATEVFRSASSTLDGLVLAYTVYKDRVIDDVVNEHDVYTLLYDLVKHDTRAEETKVFNTSIQIQLESKIASLHDLLNDLESKLHDTESSVSASHRKIAHMVEEKMTMQRRIQDLEMTIPIQDQSSELVHALEEIHDKHRQLKNELADRTRELEDHVKASSTQARVLTDYDQQISAEVLKSTKLESRVVEMTNEMQKCHTNVAVWKTRYEDTIERMGKKRKMDDCTHADLIAVTAEVNFLRNQHDEDMKRLNQSIQCNAMLTRQVHTLSMKLAFDSGV